MRLNCHIFLLVLIFTGCLVNAQDAEKDSLNESLIFAADAGDSAKVISLITRGADVDAATYEGVTPLMYATQNGNIPVMRTLLAAGANPDIKPASGYTALITAVRNFRDDLVEFLIRHGADVDVSDNTKMTPLMHAIATDSFYLADQLLYYNADIQAKRNDGMDALMMAAFFGRTGIAEELITLNADINSKDNKGRTPLHYAALAGNQEMMQLLISAGADVEARSDAGLTPLSMAVFKNNFESARFLIGAGADVNSQINTALNPLTLSREKHYDQISGMLKNNGAHILRLPWFNQYTLGGKFMFSRDDMFAGVHVGLCDHKYNLWTSFFYDIRAKSIRVLVPSEGQTYYQYWEMRHIAGAAAEKAFLFGNGKHQAGFTAGLTGGISFASYQGTGNYPRPIGILSPHVGVVYQYSGYRIRIDYNYIDLHLHKMSSNWFGITTELVIDRKKNIARQIIVEGI